VKRLAFFVVLMLLLVIGGGLTAQLAANNNNSESIVPFALKQTNDPNASVFTSVSWKSEQFFLFVGFILFNMIGMGATIAIVLWFLHRGVAQSKAEGGGKAAIQPASSETSTEEA
jgi:hypothetical protein